LIGSVASNDQLIYTHKIAEHWDVVEYLEMLQALGAIKFNTPPPPPNG